MQPAKSCAASTSTTTERRVLSRATEHAARLRASACVVPPGYVESRWLLSSTIKHALDKIPLGLCGARRRSPHAPHGSHRTPRPPSRTARPAGIVCGSLSGAAGLSVQLPVHPRCHCPLVPSQQRRTLQFPSFASWSPCGAALHGAAKTGNGGSRSTTAGPAKQRQASCSLPSLPALKFIVRAPPSQ